MRAWLPRTRAQGLALLAGVAGLLACLLLGLRRDPQQALLSWLYAFLFFTGLSIGSLALLMIHAITGGGWGAWLRAPLLAAARLLPLMALAVVPLLVGMHALYAWTAPPPDAQAQHQAWYLDSTFFIVRSVAYFILWCGSLLLFTRAIDAPPRARRLAAPGLIVFALTSLLAATDWVVSLTPHWHSSVYGMMVGTGWLLAAAALATATAATGRPGSAQPPPEILHDLGNLLLMFVLAWSYLAFMQYLTIWIADLPAENSWYIPRTLTSWRWLAWFLIAFGFALPFAVLLSRAAKRDRRWLRAVASMLAVAGLADAFWLVLPGFRATGLALRWTDLAAPVGIGGLWCCGWLGQLRWARSRHPLVAPGMEDRAHG